jgi:hypothetical protein
MPATISLLNAIILIGLGVWGYFGSETPSPTAMIPVIFGALLMVLNPGVRSHNKVVAHIAVVLTLLILFGLAMPLKGALGRSDTGAIARVAVMMASTVLALVVFINSFIQARRARQTPPTA